MRRLPALVLAGLVGLSASSCTETPAPRLRASPTPSVGFPVVEGRVLEAASDGRTTTERFAVEDPEKAYAAARRRLVDAGFQLTKDRPGKGGGDGQACTTRLCVDFSATSEQPWGPNLLYSAFHSTGVVPLR